MFEFTSGSTIPILRTPSDLTPLKKHAVDPADLGLWKDYDRSELFTGHKRESVQLHDEYERSRKHIMEINTRRLKNPVEDDKVKQFMQAVQYVEKASKMGEAKRNLLI